MSRLKFLDQMLEAARPAVYAFLFLVLASVQCIVIALILPPFQGADEAHHSMRVDAISRGQLTGLRISEGRYGGLVDPAIARANDMSRYLPFHRDQPIRPEIDAATRAVQWTGTAEPRAFGNTVIGAPPAYLPSVAGMMIGRQLGLPVAASFKVARLLNAAVYVAAGVATIALAGSAAPFLFVLLTLPMSAFVGAYVTPDGPILAATALAMVLIMNAMTRETNVAGGAPSRSQTAGFAAATIAVTLAALGKVPYVLLVPLLLCATAIHMRHRIAATAVALAVTIPWHVHAALLRIKWPGDPAGQTAYLLENPLAVFSIAVKTMRVNGWKYLQGLVGNLGWLDTPAPAWFVILAAAVLVLALLTVLCGRIFAQNDIVAGPRPIWPLLAAALCAGMIFGVVYITWVPVGQGHVSIVQGRYFLPLLPVLPLALAGIRRSPGSPRRPSRFWRPLPELAIILPYAIATPCVTIYILVDRYYR